METPSFPPSSEALLQAHAELFAHPRAIPFATRVRYVTGQDMVSGRRISDKEVAVYCKVPVDTVHQVAEDFFGNDRVYDYLPWESNRVFKEEIDWRARYNEAADLLGMAELSRLSGVPLISTRHQLDAWGVDWVALGKKRAFPKVLACRLRAEEMAFPPAEDEVTIREISEYYGCSETRTKAALDSVGAPEEYFRLKGGNHRVQPHYSPDVLDEIDELLRTHGEGAELARTMWCKDALANALGRGDNWLSARLLPYNRHAQLLPDKSGKPTLHYPEWVYAELHEQHGEQITTPVRADDELTARMIAEALGTKSNRTVIRALEELAVPSEVRLVANGREAVTYPAAAIELVRQKLLTDIATEIASTEERLRQHREEMGHRGKLVIIQRQIDSAERNLAALKLRQEQLAA